MLIYLIMLLAFISLYTIFYSILGIIYRKKLAIGIRLKKITTDSPKTMENEMNQPFFIRIIRPILDDMSKTIMKATPKEIIGVFEKKVTMAGKPYNLELKDWINIEVLLAICLPVTTIILSYYINAEPRSILFLVIIEIALSLLIPNFILSKQVTDRQKKIINSLPDVVDLLTVSVEAGLGFDGALAKVIDKMPGPLAVEFENVLQEIKVGKQKRDALKDMADRVGVQDLSTFVGSIIQADQLGVSIGNVFRIQSEQMRQKRRQRAQEKAMKAPVKMLIPMVLFIFPTIFSVLMGPVVIRVIDMFSK